MTEQEKKERKRLTPEQRLASLKAKTVALENRIQNKQRKTRNGQLISFGLLIEAAWSEPQVQEVLKDAAKKFFEKDARNMKRACAGFERLDQRLAANRVENAAS